MANSVFSGKDGEPTRRQKTRYIREFVVVALLLFALLAGFAFFSGDDGEVAEVKESAELARSVDEMVTGDTAAEAPETSARVVANAPRDTDATNKSAPEETSARPLGSIISGGETLSVAEINARAAAMQIEPATTDIAEPTPTETTEPAGAPIPIVSGAEPVNNVPEHVEAVASLQKVGDIFSYLPTRTPPQMSTKVAEPVQRSSELHIVIDKVGHTLTVFKGTEKLYTFPCAVGKNKGNKVKNGDMRTPEGKFKVSNIHDASAWTHDFGDGKGQIAGAYGPYFIRLVTPPWTGIGIHGTHDPDSMGKNVSEGCIRLRNADLRKLVPLVTTATTVEILPN